MRDEQERLTKWEPGLTNGHSVCNDCGKDMPRVWDVVCASCHRTFCYDHVRAVQGQWLCGGCFKLWLSR